MKILILCDQGNNRSVVLASRLKYCGDGHDVLTAGYKTNSPTTIAYLANEWADKVIVVDDSFDSQTMLHMLDHKTELWNIGPDRYPRPHNKELLTIVTRLIEEHPEVKQKSPVTDGNKS